MLSDRLELFIYSTKKKEADIQEWTSLSPGLPASVGSSFWEPEICPWSYTLFCLGPHPGRNKPFPFHQPLPSLWPSKPLLDKSFITHLADSSSLLLPSKASFTAPASHPIWQNHSPVYLPLIVSSHKKNEVHTPTYSDRQEISWPPFPSLTAYRHPCTHPGESSRNVEFPVSQQRPRGPDHSILQEFPASLFIWGPDTCIISAIQGCLSLGSISLYLQGQFSPLSTYKPLALCKPHRNLTPGLSICLPFFFVIFPPLRAKTIPYVAFKFQHFVKCYV